MATSKLWRAAIVGLGKIGSRFDEEPGRKSVWSHAGAYLARPQFFELSGACEVNAENVAAFATRFPDVPVVADVATLMRVATPSVVSICTPADSHAVVLDHVLQGESVRVVWCEKPLAMDAREGAAMIAACKKRGVSLVVTYNRRMAPIWIRAKKMMAEQRVGTVRMVRVAIPNRLWSMGSHAVDLIGYLGGEVTAVRPFHVPALAEQGEPAVAAFFAFSTGSYGIFQVTGWKANYLVEAEILGDEGRLIVREDRETIILERFEESSRYAGYREPAAPEIERVTAAPEFSPFVAIADEIAEMLAGTRQTPTCDGPSALAAQQLLEVMATAARPSEARMGQQ